MKWKKLGKIFDPTEHKMLNGCTEFAQSPQTLVFDDYVRIYFSTRKRDNATGQYLSHIAFVDMDKSFSKILNISKETVIPLGVLGAFDEHGIFPMNPFRHKDKIYAYTCGWSRRVSVDIDMSIGFAVSEDNGATFKKHGNGPIVTSSLNEPFLVGDPFVMEVGGMFHMWYIFGTKWINNENNKAPDRVYKIGYATSDDGIEWKKHGKKIIEDKIDINECQALPTVINFNGRYHMFFCYRAAIGFREDKNKAYRIGYAYSDDLKKWTRDDKNCGIDISSEGWDSDMMCYPHVFKCNESFYMLYNGNQFGRDGFGLAVLEK